MTGALGTSARTGCRGVKKLSLRPAFLGTRQAVSVFTYGREGDRPHVYVQAGLHAGEHPGVLVAEYLRRSLDQLADKGGVKGRISLVPLANPVGFSQILNGEINGRYDFASRSNFNRGFPHLDDALMSKLKPLTSTGFETSAVLETIRSHALDAGGADHVGQLKLDLLLEALDADIVLDLHCDGESLLHIYGDTNGTGPVARVAAELGSGVNLISDGESSEAFDDALNAIWRRLGTLTGECNNDFMNRTAMTIELRGRVDVDHGLALQDCNALLRVFDQLGVIDLPGDERSQRGASPQPPLVSLKQMEILRAQVPGIVSYTKGLGQSFQPGELIAEIIDPLEPDRSICEVRSRVGGLLFSRHISRLAFPGMELCKLVTC